MLRVNLQSLETVIVIHVNSMVPVFNLEAFHMGWLQERTRLLKILINPSPILLKR